jgi:HNH endonuclease
MDEWTVGITARLPTLNILTAGAAKMSGSDLTAPIEYREIPLLPDYRFGSDARVQKLSRGGRGTKTPAGQWADVAPSRRDTGYSWVQIGPRGVVGPVRVDEIVCRAWHGDRPDGTECVHRDGDRTNCLPENLHWGIAPEHAIDHSVEFREIPGFDGYRFYRDGVIGSQWATGFDGKTDVWRRIDGYPLGSGHIQVTIKFNGETRRFGAHHLICWAWHGPCPDGMECCHGNGQPAENREDNLRWGTPKDNSRDSILHGTMVRGEDKAGAKLTEAQVLEIRRLHANGRGTLLRSAERYGVSWSAIKKVVDRKTWTHLKDEGWQDPR